MEHSEFDLIFIKGNGWSPEYPDCGKYGRIVKVDHAKPNPYAILYEGQVDTGHYLWIKRGEFYYVHGRLSSWAALDAIEKCLSDVNAISQIKDILDQYKQGRTK